jgi:hypothetical protein
VSSSKLFFNIDCVYLKNRYSLYRPIFVIIFIYHRIEQYGHILFSAAGRCQSSVMPIIFTELDIVWRNPYHQLRTANIIPNGLNYFLIWELIEFEPNNLNSTTHMFSYSYNDIISDDLISDQLGISRRHPLPLVGK